MVSKNNHLEKIEDTAEHQAHFGIRKLSIGAASVLLSTTLWFGTATGVAQADTQDASDDNDQAKATTESNQKTNTQNVDRVVVDVTSNTSQAAQANTEDSSAAASTVQEAEKNTTELKSANSTNQKTAQAKTQKSNNVLTQDAKQNTENQKEKQTSASANASQAKIEQSGQEGQQSNNSAAATNLEKSGRLGKQNDTANVSTKQTEVAIPQADVKTTNDLKDKLSDKVTIADQKAMELSAQNLNTSKTANTTDKKGTKDTTNSDTAKQYTITIHQINDTEGGTFWNDGTYKKKAGETQDLFYNFVGYKLMNPEALTGLEIKNPASGHGTLVVPDHDIDITLHYAKLSPTVVKYVDTDGNLLTTFSDNSENSTSESVFSNQDNIHSSNFLAKAIQIPGYELVSDDTIEKPITQTYTSAKDSNPMVLTFTYKKIAQYAQQGLPNGGGADVTGNDYGDSWSDLPGGVSVDLTYDTYGSGTNHFEEQVKGMQDRYIKQGFTYLGILNNHKDSDKMNRLETLYAVHFLQNKPVTVNYIDEQGNKLADSVILNFNKNNPDQTNNGINHKENWYPSGEWKSEKKDFNGYVLDKVLGSESGQFTTFAYTTTYVYTKAANATINYIDDTSGKTLTSDKVDGGVGLTIDYSTHDKINDYEKQGYVLVSDNFSNKNGQKFNEDADKNIFEVHLRHDTVPVNPNNPDPSNPELTKDALQKTVTRTINYLNAADHGQVLADPITDTVVFSGAGTIDKVTGNLVNLNADGTIKDQNGQLTWTYLTSTGKTGNGVSYTFAPTKTVNTITKDGKTYAFVNVDNSNYDGGHGSVKAYTAKATDPQNLVVNAYYNEEKAPDVGSLIVKFHDDTTNTDIIGVGFNSGDQTVNTPVAYKSENDLKSLTNKGYVYVSTDGEIPSAITKGKTNVVIHVKHGVVPVDPSNPHTPGEPINPSDPHSPVFPDGVDSKDLTKNITRTVKYVADGTTAPKTVQDTLTFTAKGYIDQVTGQWVTVDKNGNITNNTSGMTWTIKDGSEDTGKFAGVISPELDGYHVASVSDYADGNNVRAIDVNHNNGNINITVTYVKNGHTEQNAKNILSTFTVTYVDDQGKELLPATKDSFNFHRTPDEVDSVTGKVITQGKWNAENHTYEVVNVPVINGYVAEKRTAGGQTATHDNPAVVDKVVYQKIGTIVPVDPNGNKIPNAPTPSYTNDPSDPTKVMPNEPVPNIPGYTPKTPTVTPQDPTKDTKVVYTKDPDHVQKASVIYQDINDPQNVITLHADTDLTGEPGEKINYSPENVINNLTKQGYVLLHDGFGDSRIFDNDDSEDQIFYVTFRHGTTTVTPNKPGHPGEPVDPDNPNGPKYPDGTSLNDLKKTGTQTIHYTGAGDSTPKDNVQSFDFTKKITFDNVTGEIIDNGEWNVTSHEFGTVNTPVVEGYHADKRVAGGKTVTIDNLNAEETVTYTKNGKIVPVDPQGNPIPNVDNPTYPTDPDDPTKVVPDEPVPSIPGKTPSTPTVTPQDPSKDTPVVYNNDQGSVVVIIHDQTTDTNLDQYGYNSKTVDEGTKVDYDWNTIKKTLENHGYVIVTPNVTIPSEVGKTAQTITIEVKHGTTPVNPDNPGKPGQPINPNDPDGPKWPTDSGDVTKDVTRTITFVDKNGKEVAKSITQTVHFTANGVIDKVTGEYVTPLTWSNDQSVDKVNVPVVDGYHTISIDKDADGKTSVKSVTLTHNNDDYTVKVTYEENGHIVPVDPSGNPIPNAPTPQYPTDPTNPSEVTPNEPVPNIPGMTPETSTVTPKDPGKDTKVIYNTPDTPTPVTPTVTTVVGKQTITFVDGDNGNTPLRDADVQTHTFTITDGVPNENSYTFGTINVPVIDGYVAEVKTAGGKTVTPDNPDANVTVVYHKIGKIVPVDKDHNPIPGVETPQYKNDPNDPTKVVPDEPVPTIDGYTPNQNTVTPQDPTKDTEVVYTKNEEPSPQPHPQTIPETPDTPNVPETPDEPEDDLLPNTDETIQPHSQNDEEPSEKKAKTAETVKPHSTSIKTESAVKKTAAVKDVKKNKKATLPQTGENNNEETSAAILGAAVASLGLIGLAGVKKRREID